jgi:hypothetical protein
LRAYSSYPNIQEDHQLLKVFVNEQLVGTHSFSRHGWHDLAFSLPDGDRSPFLNILLEVDKTWIPSEIGHLEDKRILGIAVNSAQLIIEESD